MVALRGQQLSLRKDNRPAFKILPVGFEQLLLVHPEHEEADEDEGAKEGKEVEAMSGEVEALKISVWLKLDQTCLC